VAIGRDTKWGVSMDIGEQWHTFGSSEHRLNQISSYTNETEETAYIAGTDEKSVEWLPLRCVRWRRVRKSCIQI